MHGPHAHGAADDEDRDGDRPLAMLERLANKLPEAARKKILDLAYEAQKRSITLRADAQRAKLELERSLQQELPDTDTVLKHMDKVGQLKTEVRKVWMKARLEATKLLTPEQREQLKRYAHGDFRREHHEPEPAH
jgi:Spy/CpxP family protein refolding chaperone